MKKILTLFIVMCTPFLGSAQLSYTLDTSQTFGQGKEGSVAVTADSNGIDKKITYTGAELSFPWAAPNTIGEELMQDNGNFTNGNLQFTPGYKDTQVYADFNQDGYKHHLRFFADPNGVPHVELFEDTGASSYFLKTGHGLPAGKSGISFVSDFDLDGLPDVFLNLIVIDHDDLDNDGNTTEEIRFAGWYKNNGNFTFTLMQTFLGLSLSSGDIGKLDNSSTTGESIIYTGDDGTSARMFYLQNNGSGFNIFELNESDGFIPHVNGAIAFGEENGDGRIDYFASTGDTVSGFVGQLKKDTGSGLFTQDLPLPFTPMVNASLLFTKSDNDSFLDLYAQGRSIAGGTVRHADIYRNTNGIDFQMEVSFPGLEQGFAVELYLNNTNQPALFVNGLGDNDSLNTKLYLNNSPSLNTNEYELNDDIVMYPNPVQDVLNIRLKNSNQLEKVQIFDIAGREIMSRNDSVINVGHLGSGIYILKLQADDGKQGTKKFVKK